MGLLIAYLVFRAFGAPVEPKSRGRTLSEWIGRYLVSAQPSSAANNRRPGLRSKFEVEPLSAGSRGKDEADEEARMIREAAIAALHDMKSEAVPKLLQWVRRKPETPLDDGGSADKRHLGMVGLILLGEVKKNYVFLPREVEGDLAYEEMTRFFLAAGVAHDHGVEALLRVAEDPEFGTKWRRRALSELSVRRLLESRQTRLFENARLRSLLLDPDLYVAQGALELVCRGRINPEFYRSAILANLTSSNTFRRNYFIQWIHCWGLLERGFELGPLRASELMVPEAGKRMVWALTVLDPVVTLGCEDAEVREEAWRYLRDSVAEWEPWRITNSIDLPTVSFSKRRDFRDQMQMGLRQSGVFDQYPEPMLQMAALRFIAGGRLESPVLTKEVASAEEGRRTLSPVAVAASLRREMDKPNPAGNGSILEAWSMVGGFLDSNAGP
jgi:hypothetical protein